MKQLLENLCADESGATAIEYGLLASLIAIVSVEALELVGTELSNTFSSASSAMAGNGAAEETPPSVAPVEPPFAAARAAPG